MEPAPEVTFKIRGVLLDLSNKEANVSTTAYGPAAFVQNNSIIFWKDVPGASPIAALLTSASNLLD